MDESSDYRCDGAGGDGADQVAGARWAFGVPVGKAGKRGAEKGCEEKRQYGAVDRFSGCGRAVGSGGFGWIVASGFAGNDRRRGSGGEPGGGFGCRWEVDAAKKDGAEGEPREDDDGAGECPGEIESATEGDGVGVGGGILWRSWRRDADGGQQARRRIFAEGLAGLGSGGAESGSAGNARGADAIWNYLGETGRRAAANDEAVSIFCGREIGVGSAMDVLGDAGGCNRG